MYLLGVVVAVGVAWLLKRTLLRGETPPFVMELPSYKWPSLRNVLYRMVERGWSFLDRAGTVIFAVSIVVWALAYYPRSDAKRGRRSRAATRRTRGSAAQLPTSSPPSTSPNIIDRPRRQPAPATQLPGPRRASDRAGRPPARLGLADRLRGDRLVPGPRSRDGRAGRDLQPRAATSTSATRATRAGSATQLRAARWDDTGEPVYNIPVALSIMVFFALCAPVRRDAGRDPPRNEQLALAGVHVRLHDGAGLRRRLGDLPDRHPLVG